jgi:photosystem I subunit 4
MISSSPQDKRQDDVKYEPEDNPGTETTVPTTEDGNTPLDERYRMTSQKSDADVSSGAEPEAPGASPKVIGAPNQGTESR